MLNSLWGNENFADWVPLIIMIGTVLGYLFVYRPMLKRENRKEMSARGIMDVMSEPVTETEKLAYSRMRGSGFEDYSSDENAEI